MIKRIYAFLAVAIVVLSLGVTVNADTSIKAEGEIVEFSVPTEVYRNSRKSNYRVLRDWYYVYSYNVGVDFYGNGVGREIKVYHRRVSYTLDYDVYTSTGKYLRHERKHNVTATEEQYR